MVSGRDEAASMYTKIRALGTTVAVMAALMPATAAANTETLVYHDPGEYDLNVPPEVTSIHVEAAGGRGGNGYAQTDGRTAQGGLGGGIFGTLPVGSNRHLVVQVGLGGGAGDSSERAGA